MHNFTFKILGLLFANPSAHACASCGLAGDSNSYYLLLILIMTSIPLFMVGGIVFYLRRLREQHDLDEQ